MRLPLGWLLLILVPNFAHATPVHAAPSEPPPRTLDFELEMNDQAQSAWQSTMVGGKLKWDTMKSVVSSDQREVDLIDEAIDDEATLQTATMLTADGQTFLHMTLVFKTHEQMIKASALIENAARAEAPVDTSLTQAVKNAYPSAEPESVRFYLSGDYETETRKVLIVDANDADDAAMAESVWQSLGFPMAKPVRYKKGVGLSVFFFQVDNVEFGIFVNSKKVSIGGDPNDRQRDVSFGVTLLVTF